MTGSIARRRLAGSWSPLIPRQFLPGGGFKGVPKGTSSGPWPILPKESRAPLTSAAVNTRWRACFAAMGLPPDEFSCHSARAGRTSNLVEMSVADTQIRVGPLEVGCIPAICKVRCVPAPGRRPGRVWAEVRSPAGGAHPSSGRRPSGGFGASLARPPARALPWCQGASSPLEPQRLDAGRTKRPPPQRCGALQPSAAAVGRRRDQGPSTASAAALLLTTAASRPGLLLFSPRPRVSRWVEARRHAKFLGPPKAAPIFA